MAKILVVEDDENNRAQIESFLREHFSDHQVVFARSLRSGLIELEGEPSDLIILDMTLPNFDQGPDEDGGVIHPLGGQEFLRRMKRRNIKIPEIVLTQFESFGIGADSLELGSLRKRLESKYANVCVETIHYNNTVETWKRRLQTAMTKVMKE
jgi:CheY-like chemotaxis protein